MLDAITVLQRKWRLGRPSSHKRAVLFTHAILFGTAIVLGITADVFAFQRNPRVRRNQTVTVQEVRRSIAQGVNYLKDRRRNGAWRDITSVGDVTALAALALLNAGESPDDERMQLTLQYIADQMHVGALTTYSASLKVMALAAAEPNPKKNRYLREIENAAGWLIQNQLRNGGWTYNNTGGSGDSSNSQFAILALHAAVGLGLDVPQQTWEKAERYWEKCYVRGGGFGYSPNRQDVRPSMSCAGISSWIIIQENLADFKELVKGDRARACADTTKQQRVEETIKWLSQRFGVAGRNPDYYYLYALERAGRLSGQRFIGVHDWYRSGTTYLVNRNKRNLAGYWVGTSYKEDLPEVATAMALLFLSKGKRPVALAKYQYGQDQRWDNHPQGVHYLTRELEKQWETKLNWQTVKGGQASVDDLLESPVLFLSGTDSFEFSQQQKENLRKYVDNGGFIFAEACDGEGCGNASGFDRSFRALMAEIFPESNLEVIEADHPVWNSHFQILPNEERPLLGLQACCRTSVIYCTANLSSYWNLNRPGLEQFVKKNGVVKLQERVDYCAGIGVNVVAYATGRELRERGDTPTVKNKKTASVLVNRATSFGILNHSGGGNEAPNALKNILKVLQESGKPDVDLKRNLVEAELTQLYDYPILFMHGRSEFKFDPEQRLALKAHLESGGLIFANSICSNEAFTNSFREEVKLITGQPLKPIGKDHEIWGVSYNGVPIKQVTVRQRDPNAEGGFRPEIGPPKLEGVQYDGRLGIVFSPYDLSCALENISVSQCTGYTRADAERIGVNVILYALRVD